MTKVGPEEIAHICELSDLGARQEDIAITFGINQAYVSHLTIQYLCETLATTGVAKVMSEPEFSTFADGEDCRECLEREKSITQLKAENERLRDEIIAEQVAYGSALGAVSEVRHAKDAENAQLQAVKIAAMKVVSQTTADAAYRLHDDLIAAIEAAEVKRKT